MEWEALLRANFHHFDRLSGQEQNKLRGDVRVFAAEKEWEGCRGLEITDEIRVTIGAQACLLTLGFEADWYADVTAVLVYPAGYIVPERRTRPGGIVQEYRSRRIGEAWSHGPVVVSWSDALAGGRGEAGGRNVVLHEFAHTLDMRTGPPNGVPRLESEAQYREWEEVMSAEYGVLQDRARAFEPTLLDAYGATHGSEFFACATECFFEQSLELREQHPRLYDALKGFYRQDPALIWAGRACYLPKNPPDI